MDDSQSPGDIAHASALNDGQLLFTPLSNYLYGFVSVRLSAFWTCCFFLSVAQILCRGKKKKKKIPSFCSLVMLRLFLESKQMYPSLWYRHVVWSSGENRRREGCSYVEKPFHMEDTTVWSCEHTNKWTRCVVLRTMETFLLRLDFPCRFWTLIMWEWQELEKSMKMHHYNSAGMHFHSKPFSLESVSRKLWSEVSSFVSPLVKYFMLELSLIHVLNTAEQSLKIAQRAPGASVPLNTFVPSLWEIHHIFSVNSEQEQLWS